LKLEVSFFIFCNQLSNADFQFVAGDDKLLWCFKAWN